MAQAMQYNMYTSCLHVPVVTVNECDGYSYHFCMQLCLNEGCLFAFPVCSAIRELFICSNELYPSLQKCLDVCVLFVYEPPVDIYHEVLQQTIPIHLN